MLIGEAESHLTPLKNSFSNKIIPLESVAQNEQPRKRSELVEG
jgi:hypothetical protein